MKINELIKIIQRDMLDYQYQYAGKIFLEIKAHSMEAPAYIFHEWQEVKSNPNGYIFWINADQIWEEYDMSFIAESVAVEAMKSIGAYHYGMPTEVEIRDFLNREAPI